PPRWVRCALRLPSPRSAPRAPTERRTEPAPEMKIGCSCVCTPLWNQLTGPEQQREREQRQQRLTQAESGISNQVEQCLAEAEHQLERSIQQQRDQADLDRHG